MRVLFAFFTSAAVEAELQSKRGRARERDRLGLGKDSVAVAIVRAAETHFHCVDSQTISGSPVVEVLCRVAPVLHAFRPTVQVDSVL